MNKEEKLVDAVWILIRETPFVPGDRLPSERALAVRLGVNRHTLRGALRRMAALGVLAIRPGSGCYVVSTAQSPPCTGAERAPFESRPLEGHLEARYVLEPAIGAVAAQKATAEDIGDLENGLMRISRAMMTGRTDEITAEHQQFQNRLAACTRNPELERIGRQLAGERRAFCHTLIHWDQAAQEALFSACVAIVNSFKQGDSQRARRQIQAHILQDCRLLKRAGQIELPAVLENALVESAE